MLTYTVDVELPSGIGILLFQNYNQDMRFHQLLIQSFASFALNSHIFGKKEVPKNEE